MVKEEVTKGNSFSHSQELANCIQLYYVVADINIFFLFYNEYN